MARRFSEEAQSPAGEKARKSRRARGRALVIFYISAFLAVVVGAVLLCTFVFFRVGTVEITGGASYRQEDISSVCSIHEGDNLVLLDTRAREEALEYRFPYIENVEIRKHIPSTVEVVITEAETAFSIEREDGRYVYVSPAGKVLEIADSPAENSAVVHGCTPTNEKPSEQVAFENETAERLFSAITEELQAHDLEGITDIDLRNQYDITMTYEGRIVFRFGNSNDLEYKTRFGIGMLVQMQEDGDLTEETRGGRAEQGLLPGDAGRRRGLDDGRLRRPGDLLGRFGGRRRRNGEQWRKQHGGWRIAPLFPQFSCAGFRFYVNLNGSAGQVSPKIAVK